MQVTPVFRALTEEESSELKEAWQTCRKGIGKGNISDLSKFEATIMDQILSNTKVR